MYSKNVAPYEISPIFLLRACFRTLSVWKKRNYERCILSLKLVVSVSCISNYVKSLIISLKISSREHSCNSLTANVTILIVFHWIYIIFSENFHSIIMSKYTLDSEYTKLYVLIKCSRRAYQRPWDISNTYHSLKKCYLSCLKMQWLHP